LPEKLPEAWPNSGDDANEAATQQTRKKSVLRSFLQLAIFADGRHAARNVCFMV
jgi:hypothetical protein